MKFFNTTLNHYLKILLLGLITTFCLAASASDANAATLTWDGGGADNNWSTAANWSPDAVPTSADATVFNATSVKNATIDAAFTVSSITINNGYTGTITQNAVFTVSGLFSQRAGTFQGTAANATFVSFSLENGAFVAPSGTLTINGSGNYFLHNGGTYNHNNGSIVFSGGGAINFYNYNGSVYIPETFNNVTIAKQALQQSEWTVSGTLNLQSGGSILYGIVNSYGNVNYDAGFLNGNSRLIFQGAATLGVQLPDSLDLLPMRLLNPNVTVTSGNGAALTRLQELDLQQGTFQQGTAPLNLAVFTESSGRFLGSAATLTTGDYATISGGTFQGGMGMVSFGAILNQSGGIFSTLGDASVGNINLTGGTFNAPSGLLTIVAAFTHTAGGTFNAGTGTVKFTGYNTYNCINQIGISVATETFNSLQFDNSFCNQRYLSGTLVVNNNFRLTTGSLVGGRIRPLGTTTIDASYTNYSSSTVVEYLAPNTNFVINNPASTVAMMPIEFNAANSNLTSFGAGRINFNAMTLLSGTLNQPNAIWDFTTYPGYSQSGGTFNGSAAALFLSNGLGNPMISGGVFSGGTGKITSSFRMSGGTFSTLGDLDTSAFSLEGGTFNAPAGTMKFTGGNGNCYFTHTAASGIFNAGTGTVEVQQGICGFDVNVSETFNNLRFNVNQNVISANDTLVVNGTMTFNAGGGSNGGSIVANGDVVYSNGGGNGNTIVKFIDSATRTLNFNSSSASYTALVTLVNNPNIVINLGTLTNTTARFNALTLQQGTINQGAGQMFVTTAFAQSGGIYNGGTFAGNQYAPSTQFEGDYTLSNGTFNAAPFTNFAGNYTHTAGGNFNYGTGTVIFGGTSGTIDVNTTEDFNNVFFQMTSPATSKTIAAGDTLIVNGTTGFQVGYLNGGTVNAKGNVSVVPNFNGGTAALTFSGAANQTFTNAGGLTTSGAWTINKPNSVSLPENNFAPAASSLVTSGNIGSVPSGIFPALSVVAGSVQKGAGDFALSNLTLASGTSFDSLSNGTFTFAGAIQNDGALTLDANGAGCQADNILIRSSATGVQRAWNGSGTFRLFDVDVRDQAGSAPITAYSSTNSGNNGANWTFSSLCGAPTAATVTIGGRVVTAEGKSVSNATLVMIDGSGQIHFSRTNPFGYYRFENIPPGATYTITVSHKTRRFTNATRVLTVTQDAGDLDFVAAQN